MLLWCVHAVMLLWCVRAVMLLWCVQTRRTPTWTPRCHNTHTHTHTHTLPQASTDRRVKPYTSNYHQHKFQLPPPQITSTSNIHQRSPTTHTLPLPTHRHQRHPSKATCITITWHQHHAQTTTSSNHLPVAQQTNTYTMPIRLSSSPHMPSPQPPATTAIPLVQRQRCQNICSHTHTSATLFHKEPVRDTLHIAQPTRSTFPHQTYLVQRATNLLDTIRHLPCSQSAPVPTVMLRQPPRQTQNSNQRLCWPLTHVRSLAT